jgi:2-polyprenyl-3-methyl-5-hydroxy-6-metoxy-1,4-benzoquinol methylase
MVDINECPICKNRSLELFRTCTDFTVSHETFSVVRCTNCSLGITSPRPETEKLGAYYQSDEYISHSGKSSGLMGPLYKRVRAFALGWKARIISRYHETGSALDLGCGTGEFLATLKERGWSVDGIEPSDLARKKAEHQTNQKINSSLSEIAGKQYDVITAWHVIEHVPDLNETFRQLRQSLKKNGTIFIAVPNYESPDAAKYSDHWAAYDVPRHLWHFSKKSMTQLLASNGLQLKKILPMKLDALYVSMLSENYLNNNSSTLTTLLKGMISGLRSNAAAGSENYSSLIYIVTQA